MKQLAMVGSVAGTGKGSGRQDLLLCGSIGSLATPATVLCYIDDAPEQCRPLVSVTGLQVAYNLSIATILYIHFKWYRILDDTETSPWNTSCQIYWTGGPAQTAERLLYL